MMRRREGLLRPRCEQGRVRGQARPFLLPGMRGFGTIGCNANHINARCKRMLGHALNLVPPYRAPCPCLYGETVPDTFASDGLELLHIFLILLNGVSVEAAWTL